MILRRNHLHNFVFSEFRRDFWSASEWLGKISNTRGMCFTLIGISRRKIAFCWCARSPHRPFGLGNFPRYMKILVFHRVMVYVPPTHQRAIFLRSIVCRMTFTRSIQIFWRNRSIFLDEIQAHRMVKSLFALLKLSFSRTFFFGGQSRVADGPA